MANREIGGVGLAFGGFVFLVLAVKGTFGKVWNDLFKGGSASGSNQQPGAPTYDGTGRPSSTGGYYKVGPPGHQTLIPIDPNKGSIPVVPEASYFPTLNPPLTPGGPVTSGSNVNV